MNRRASAHPENSNFYPLVMQMMLGPGYDTATAFHSDIHSPTEPNHTNSCQLQLKQIPWPAQIIVYSTNKAQPHLPGSSHARCLHLTVPLYTNVARTGSSGKAHNEPNQTSEVNRLAQITSKQGPQIERKGCESHSLCILMVKSQHVI